jgi:anti-sigma factor RsiW
MLYLDSEGDPEMHLRVSDHLGLCPDCAEWFARRGRFEQALAERLAETAEPELWDRVLARAGVTPPARSRRRGIILGGVLAAALVVLASLIIAPALRRPTLAELPRLTADCHARHLRGISQIEFLSGDDLAVERYIRRQVGFPVHCPPRKDVGFTVEGGGVCRWAPEPMAYIVGRVEQTSVSIFLLDRAKLDTFPHDRDRLARGRGRYRGRQSGYHTVSGVTAENVVVVVGTAPPEVVEKILNAYDSSPEG